MASSQCLVGERWGAHCVRVFDEWLAQCGFGDGLGLANMVVEQWGYFADVFAISTFPGICVCEQVGDGCVELSPEQRVLMQAACQFCIW